MSIVIKELPRHLGTPPILSKPLDGKNLFVYLAVYAHAPSATFVRMEGFNGRFIISANDLLELKRITRSWKNLPIVCWLH